MSSKRKTVISEKEIDEMSLLDYVRTIRHSSSSEKLIRLRVMLNSGDMATLPTNTDEPSTVEIRAILKDSFSGLLNEFETFPGAIELLSEMFPYPPSAISKAGILLPSSDRKSGSKGQTSNTLQSLVEVADLLAAVRKNWGLLSKIVDLLYVLLSNSLKAQMQSESIYQAMLALDLSSEHGNAVTAEKIINLTQEIIHRHKATLDGKLGL